MLKMLPRGPLIVTEGIEIDTLRLLRFPRNSLIVPEGTNQYNLVSTLWSLTLIKRRN